MAPSAPHQELKTPETDLAAGSGAVSGVDTGAESGAGSGTGAGGSADLSVWLIWAVIMLLAIAALPFAVRSQDVVRAIARMCGFELG